MARKKFKALVKYPFNVKFLFFSLYVYTVILFVTEIRVDRLEDEVKFQSIKQIILTTSESDYILS